MPSYTGTNANNTFAADSLEVWVIQGLGGNDTLAGHNLGDFIYGGGPSFPYTSNTGNDTLYGYGGNDYIYGQDGNDRLYGMTGSDYLSGDLGLDILYGGDGNDLLYGGGSTDYLYGENGNDRLYGQGGNDIMFGGAGNDFFDGGSGNDNLYGSSGIDRFRYSDGGGTDRIKDFSDGVDKIVINVTGFNSYTADIAPNKHYYDNDGNGSLESTYINFGSGQFLVIQNILPGQLSGADFEFV